MYKTPFTILLLLNVLTTSCGQQQKESATANRPASTPVNQDAIADTSGFRVPDPTGWVNDFAYLFSTAEEKYFDSLLGSNEIAIVTIPDSWTTAEKFDSLIVAIHNQWGVGKKDKNNGIVIGISPTLRKIRISNGFGIEAMLTDDETKNIIENIIFPEFKQEHFFEGTKKGVLAIMKELQ